METIQMVTIIFCAISFIMSMVGLGLGLRSIITVEALKRSTHNIQYVDPNNGIDDNFFTDDQGFQEIDDKTREKLEDELDIFGDETKYDKIKY